MPDLQRLLGIAHDRTHRLPSNAPMRDLFARAADAAERLIDAPVGTAIAAVLALEAVSGRDSPLGRSEPLIALALAVLDLAQESGRGTHDDTDR